MVLGLLVRAASAAGLLLPAGEEARAWADAIALAGLEPGCPTPDECVRVEVDGGRWRLSAGGRVSVVSAPRTASERVEVAQLAASLAVPLVPLLPLVPLVPLVPLDPPPAAAETPRRAPHGTTRARSPTPRPPEDVVVDPPAIVPPGEIAPPTSSVAPPEPDRPVTDVEVAPTVSGPGDLPETRITPTATVDAPPALAADPPRTAAPLPPRAPWTPALRVELGAAVQPGLAPTALGRVAVGANRRRWGIEAGVAGALPAALVGVDPVYDQARTELAVTGTWAPTGWLALGPALGASHVRWRDRGALTGEVWLPMVGPDVRASWPGARADVSLAARMRLDLRGVSVTVGGAEAGNLSRVSAQVSVGVVIHPWASPK